MDPPSYGRGPNGEVWKIEEQLYPLIQACMEILDDDPLFFLVNSYTTGFPPTALENLLHATIGKKYVNGVIDAGEIGLPITKSKTSSMWNLWQMGKGRIELLLYLIFN